MKVLLPLFGVLATVTVFLFFLGGMNWWKASRYLVGYIPTLYTSMLCGYHFADKDRSSMSLTKLKVWGRVADLISCVLLSLVIYVALSPNCLWLKEQDAIDLRPQYEARPAHSHVDRLLHDHKHNDNFFPTIDNLNNGAIDDFRFNKFSFISDIDSAYHEYRLVLPHSNFNSSTFYEDLLPLTKNDYPISYNAEISKMLKDETTATSVVTEEDKELKWDVSELIEIVGGHPTHPSSDENNDFWNQLASVMELRKKRRTAKAYYALNSEFQLPKRWKHYSVDEVAEAVHDEVSDWFICGSEFIFFLLTQALFSILVTTSLCFSRTC